MKLTNLDPDQIVRYSFDEDLKASRVSIVGADFKVNVDSTDITNAIKDGLKDVKFESSVPVQTEEKVVEIHEIRVPEIIREVVIERIEVPVIVRQIETIDKPIVIPQIKIVEIEKPVIIKETVVQQIELPKYINVMFIIQAIGMVLVAFSLLKRG